MRLTTFIKALWTGLMASPYCLRALMSLPRAPITLDERLAMMPTSSLPLRAPVTVYFDQHQIPFIVAEDDRDAAFALGLVHAHLRLAQMEVLRRIALGRVAEMLGPLAIPLDETLRTLDLARAAPRIEAALPSQTRDWMQAFIDGVNLYVRRVERLPLEIKALGLHGEAWTVRDLVAIGRLVGSDINWLIGAELLRCRRGGDWPKIWARLTAGPDEAERARRLETSVLQQCGRSGSNCLAVGAQKTKRKAAILAGDPHVSLLLPNTWLIAGVQSPSFHAVGLMAPGLPVFMMGRTEQIAWGGTYLRAASSDFVDVSGICRSNTRLRRERMKVRWWGTVEVTIRETEWGPVVSNCPLFKGAGNESFALRWIGHDESDEFSALLGAARARDFESFRAAFHSYAVSGQTFLYADVDGNIGRVTAARLPARDAGPPADLLCSPGETTQAWSRTISTEALPVEFNLRSGHIVSANEQPKSQATIGYFFSPPDRAERMTELLEGEPAIDLEQIFSVQSDVRVRSSMALRDLVLAKVREMDVAASFNGTARTALEAISRWDGDYTERSEGALAFEVCRAALVAELCEPPLVGSDWAAFASIAALENWIRESIAHASMQQLNRALAAGMEAAGKALPSFGDWGGVHRLRLSHPLGLLPVVGRSFRYTDLPVGGSSESIFKTAHGPVHGRHNVLFGSNARHVFDLSDPDENYFVLLGGQDGWIGSTTFLDQVALWRSGRYVKVPLKLDAVQHNAAVRVELTP
jgi:penicillin amidase